MKVEIKEKISQIYDGNKFVYRNVKLELPISLKSAINKGLPEGTIYDLQPQDSRNCLVEIQDEKICFDLSYWYQAPATKEDIEKDAKDFAKKQIDAVRENLKMLCDKNDLTMEQLMDLVIKKED